jgi:hypothetical protein
MSRQVVYRHIELPEFGLPEVEPKIPAETYRARLNQLARRALNEGYDLFVVYGDREHFANLAFLTGYDPRFEEALLLLDVERFPEQKPLLLVGNEGVGYAAISPIVHDLEVVRFQSFSLLGQDRGSLQPLATLLHRVGAGKGKQVGVAGWKHFSPAEAERPELRLEIPSYIADELRALCGGVDKVRNANAILMDSQQGLRSTNDVDQLARFEFAASYSSQAVRNVLYGIRPDMSEFEAVGLMNLTGMPQSCHLMLSAGPRAAMGLPSPSGRIIRHGDPFTTAYGVWGALNCRAGFVVGDANELPEGIGDYLEKLVVPYFAAVVAWYESAAVGITGGELHRVVMERVGDPFFGVGLNPGHLIHLDEWVHSPIYAGSAERLLSGMALQVDIIPATHSPYFTTNIEDGIAVADAALRAEFAARYPAAWRRIQARRDFMINELGIRLGPDVLPFSNIPAYLPPFLLSPDRAMAMADSTERASDTRFTTQR